MEFLTTSIPGVIIVRPKIYMDRRGHFLETYHAAHFAAAGLPTDFQQDNQSCSAKGVIRGLHFQRPPFAQGKLVRVVRGSAYDVAVDLRLHSPTYGQHFALVLSDENHLMLWIPEGFAHGFHSLEDDTVLAYKCTRIFNASAEGSLRWNDPELGIDWGNAQPLLSEKDQEAPLFEDLITPFFYE